MYSLIAFEKELSHSNVTVCAHDSGGANVLAHLLSKTSILPKFVLGGPAIKIFREVLGPIPFKESITVIDEQGTLLSSTGSHGGFEFKIMKMSQDLGARIIPVLDHWTFYQERFTSLESAIRVNELITLDKHASKIATNEFPTAKIFEFNNYYIESIVQEYLALITENNVEKNRFDFLYLGEKNNDLLSKGKYDDNSALQFFHESILSKAKSTISVLFRPHPGQNLTDLRNRLQDLLPNAIISENSSIALDFARSKNIVGCNSMALAIAKNLGKPTYSSVPQPYKTLLPIADILPINEIII